MSIQDEVDRIKKQLGEMEKETIKVAFFGQPGAGKSSLINALVGDDVCMTGVGTDTTLESNSHKWNGLQLIDLPGYGTKQFNVIDFLSKFPVSEYDLFICVVSGKFHEQDNEMFQALFNANKVCLFVRNFYDALHDKYKSRDQLMEEVVADIRKQTNRMVDIIFTSCASNYGLDRLSKAIFSTLSDSKKEKWVRFAKAYSQDFLEQKKLACEKYILFYAGASALNAFNPIPGVDVAVDATVILNLFSDIRNTFGLSSKLISSKMNILTPVLQTVNNVMQYATKEGIAILLKSFAGREVVKGIGKYIPLIGQVVASSVGFGIVYQAGMSYLGDCYTVAKSLLDSELNEQCA
jgi:GTP-binding protein EngB required for normal cell division/uncharacterized protein (DUF697 family)